MALQRMAQAGRGLDRRSPWCGGVRTAPCDGDGPTANTSTTCGAGAAWRLPIGAGGGVIGIIVLLVVTFLGGGGGGGAGGWGDVLDQLPGAVQQPEGGQGAQANQEEAEFVNFLTEDIQAVWEDEFAERGDQYTYARLNLFTGQVATACGNATSAVGPSTARPTARCTSTSTSTASWPPGSTPPATSPRRT